MMTLINSYANVSSVTFYREYERDFRISRKASYVMTLADYDNNNDNSFLLASLYREGRQTSFSSVVSGLSSLSNGYVCNFGSDGETILINGRYRSGVVFDFSSETYGNFYLDVVNLGSPSFMNWVSVETGSTVSILGSGNAQDVLVVSIDSEGRHADFCSTVQGLSDCTSGLVSNFGADGEVIAITGDRNYGFSIEVSNASIMSARVSITNLSQNSSGYQIKTLINNYEISSGASISLSSATDLYDMLIVSVNQNGRHVGFCSIGVDLVNAVEGITKNFGADGRVIEVIGNGKNSIRINPSTGGKFNLTICELVLPNEYHTGDMVSLNTFDDFHMVPTKRIGINPPAPNYNIMSITGTEKRLDITDYLPSGSYKTSRTGNWEFYIDHYLWPDWVTAHDTISKFLNGHKVLAVLKEDPIRAYEGYVKVSNYSPGKNYSIFSIAYDFDPVPKTALSRAPIRFIKSNGTYYDLEYVFDSGIEHVFPLDSMSYYGKSMQLLSLSGGMYSRTPVKSGGLIKFDSVSNKGDIIVISVSNSGRFCSLIGTAIDLMSTTAGEIHNFGSDGKTAWFKGDGYSGMFVNVSDSNMREVKVTISEPECTMIRNHETTEIDSYVNMSGISNQNEILFFSIYRYGNHVSFCSTAYDIVHNTEGTVYSFGLGGEIIVVTGNGTDSFKIEATDENIETVSLTIASFDSTSLYITDTYAVGEDVGLRYVSGDTKLIAVSSSFEGRQSGFCITKADLCECIEGKVLNFGADGEVLEVIGDGRYCFAFDSEIVGDDDISVTVSEVE